MICEEMKKEDLRIIFMGTPEFAVETLKVLVDNNYNVVAVVTQPDKPVGRHQNELQPSEVKKFALSHNLPVLQPVKMKDPEFVEELRSYHANLQVVVAFRMLPDPSGWRRRAGARSWFQDSWYDSFLSDLLVRPYIIQTNAARGNNCPSGRGHWRVPPPGEWRAVPRLPA